MSHQDCWALGVLLHEALFFKWPAFLSDFEHERTSESASDSAEANSGRSRRTAKVERRVQQYARIPHDELVLPRKPRGMPPVATWPSLSRDRMMLATALGRCSF